MKTEVMFKTKILICHSKPKLNVKILFGKVTHIFDPIKIKENVSDGFVSRILRSILGSMICFP